MLIALFENSIYIKINKWNISNWLEWQASNMYDCKVWSPGYILNGDSSLLNNTWVEDTSVSASITSQAIVGSIVVFSGLLSICNLSTPHGLWMAIDQFQLILLLLLAKANIPQRVVDYLSGMKDTTWSFNIIPLKRFRVSLILWMLSTSLLTI